MGTIQRFEDIEGWQKARALTKEIYSLTKSGEFSKDFGLRDQIRRGSVSIMSNIAEGFERGGSKEFKQFLSLAKGSAGEVKSQLYAALDQQYLTRDQFDSLYGLTDTIARQIGAFMKYLAGTKIRGSKFK